jgi:hypothetical protein
VNSIADRRMTLTAIEFTSDHGILRDNRDSWDESGARFAKPEWRAAEGADSRPISHTKAQTVGARLTLDVTPETAPPVSVQVRGDGPGGFVDFETTATLGGGRDQKVDVRSTQPLPDKVDAYLHQSVLWSAGSGADRQMIGASHDHNLFATYDTPQAVATYRRMAMGIALTRGVGLDPHAVVSAQMKRFPFYNLKNPVSGNIWVLADEIPAFGGKGADCQSIVRFVAAVNKVIGLPGEAKGIAIYASPAAPATPLTSNLVEGGGADGGMWQFGNISLFDADDNANNYEAALQFTTGGDSLFADPDRLRRFYPGGVPGGRGLKTKEDVLHAFKQMAEGAMVGGKFVPVRTIWCYEKDANKC